MKLYQSTAAPQVTIIEVPNTEISKIDFALCQQPRESLESFYNRQINKPQILINGGFFNMSNGETVFNFIDEREEINDVTNYKWGMAVTAAGLQYGHMDKIANLRDFVSGYPNMLDAGQFCNMSYANEINYVARRTAIGYNSTTTFIFICDEPGIKLEPFRQIMKDADAKYAINLDGGGSTRLLVDGKLKSDNLWSRPVDNVVAFYLQEAAPRLFRVQVGAYGVKANADKQRVIIQALPDTIGAGYRNAYVRFIEPYYKVQVGAFSVKANADKVVADLKRLGISAFVTDK